MAKYIEGFRYKITIWETPEERYKTISEYAIEANDSLQDVEIELLSKQIPSLLKSGQSEEINKFISNPDFINKPLFKAVDPKVIFEILINSDNSLIYLFRDSLSSRYHFGCLESCRKKEDPFFIPFFELLNAYIEGVSMVRVSTVALIELRKVINKIIKIHD